MKEARLRLQQNRLETLVTRNGILPRIDLFIDLGLNGYGNGTGSSLPELSDHFQDMRLGLSLSQYLGNRAAKARHRSAELSRQRAEAAIDNLEYKISFDVSLAINEVERNRRQISASRTTRLFEEQTLKAEQEKFNVGTGTALLVAQAQRDLLASRIAEIRSVINYRIALVRLYLAEGSLLQRRGISIGSPET